MCRTSQPLALAIACALASACASTGGAAASGDADSYAADSGQADSDAAAVTDAQDAQDAAAATADTADATPDAAASDVTAPTPDAKQATSKGSYEISIYGPLAVSKGKKTTWKAHIASKDGAPTLGAALKVTFIHLAMGHGGSTIPKVTELGSGDYEISNATASMAGKWALTLELGGESAAFDVEAK